MKFRIIVILLLCFCKNVEAQDPIFSQYFLIPETLNPSFSGFMETTYAGIIHRTQWPELDLKISTQYGFVNTYNDRMNSSYGLSILNQHENNTSYNHSQLNFNYAYKVRLDRDWYFKPGIEIGYGLKSYAFQNLVLADQINIGNGTINTSSIDQGQMMTIIIIVQIVMIALMLLVLWLFFYLLYGILLKKLNKN